MDQIERWLDTLEAIRFFGSVTFKIENGLVTYVREERGMRPEELLSSTPKGNANNNSRR